MLTVVTSVRPSTTIGARERLVDALGRLVHLLGVPDALQDDDELVAPHAHDDVLGADGGADALRHGLEQLVAGLMPARVVDVLEAVEVEEQHREQRAVLLGLLDGVGQVRAR